MVYLDALDRILSVRNGVWSCFLVLCMVAWRGWPHIPAIITAWATRRAAINAEKHADWTRRGDELHRLVGRVDHLEEREEDCQNKLRQALEELAQMRGYAFGHGKARQDAAGIIALERADPDKAITSREKFGEGDDDVGGVD